MIIQIKDNITIEVIRHEDLKTQREFLSSCDFSVDQFEEISNFDFFTLEVRATNSDLKTNSEYLGECCYETFEIGLGSKFSGYLDQMIAEAIVGLNQL